MCASIKSFKVKTMRVYTIGSIFFNSVLYCVDGDYEWDRFRGESSAGHSTL